MSPSQLLGQAKDDILLQSFHGQAEVKEHFQRGALIAWYFHPADEKKQHNEKL